MALGDAVLGNATTLSFGTALSGIEILDFDWSNIERASVDVAYMGLTGGKPFIFSDQYNPGTLDITVHFDDTRDEMIADLANAMTTVSALTLTFPQTGATSAATWATPNAALVSMGVSGAIDDKITQALSFKLTGDITITDGA